MKKFALISFGTSLAVPALALAQRPDFTYAEDVVNQGVGWLQTSISVIMILITVFFLYSVLRYVMTKESKDLPERRKTMIAALIGVFIAVSVWGIVRIAQRTTGTTGNNSFFIDMTCPPGQRPVGGACI